MGRIVALEGSTAVGSVALVAEGDVKAEVLLNLGLGRSERLLSALQYLLKQSMWGPADISAVAVGLGPGSFTGVRIAVGAAKALAYGWDCPIVGVSTLDVLAAQAMEVAALWPDGTKLLPPLVCAAVYARRRDMYVSLYDLAEARDRPVWGPRFSGLDELFSFLENQPYGDRQVLFVGNGPRRLWTELEGRLGSRAELMPLDFCFPRAGSVGREGERRWHSGRVDDPMRLVPTYMKLPEAEEKWRQRS